jgi:hypothetical protein
VSCVTVTTFKWIIWVSSTKSVSVINFILNDIVE